MQFFIPFNHLKSVLLHFVHIFFVFIKIFFLGILIYYCSIVALEGIFYMRISPLNLSSNLQINNVNVQNVQNSNHVYNMALKGADFSDTVSFKGEKQFKYTDSWYLKGQEILDQDGFTTTVEDKQAKVGMFDKLLKKTHPKKIYDLPLRLREDLTSKGTDTVILRGPNDVLNETGLSNEEFIKDINKINTMISLVYPRYDSFEDETKQSFEMKMGNSTANVTRLRQGLSGIVYKIEVEGCRPLALKHYLHPQKVNQAEGPFPEIAIAKKMNEDNVSNIPLLYCANPYEGWMLSEFVDKDYEARKDGVSILDYASANELIFGDRNTGNTVRGKDGRIFVDFGYIEPAFSNGCTLGFEKVVCEDVVSRANSKDDKDKKYTSTLGHCADVSLYGNGETRKALVQKYADNPEFKLFCDALQGTRYALAGKDMPKDLEASLQESFEKSGFVGDAVELVQSCKQ